MRPPYALSLAFGALVLGCATAVVSPDDIVDTYDAAPAPDGAKPQYDSGWRVADTSLPVDDSATDPDAGGGADTGPSSACAFTGTLATYDFVGEPGNQSGTKATSSASNITAGDITRAGTITATVGTNSINGSNWATSSSVDKTRYYTLTLTPSSACAVDITSISVDTKASGTGPVHGAVATSDDSFGKSTTFTTSSATSAAVSVSGASAPVEIRVYGFGASGSGGTFRMQNTITVTGTLK